MAEWLKKQIQSLKENTRRMDRRQKAEYVLTYYWYHLLFLFLGTGLLVLAARHLFFGEEPKAFNCVMVNQAVDYDRDETLEETIAGILGVPSGQVLVDSDYIFSYGDRKLEGVNESSYEKFFFRWGLYELDAVLMPESFYWHCRELEYEFLDLNLLMDGTKTERGGSRFLTENGHRYALYLDQADLASGLNQTEDDKMVLAFIRESMHMEADRLFLEAVLGETFNWQEGVWGYE